MSAKQRQAVHQRQEAYCTTVAGSLNSRSEVDPQNLTVEEQWSFLRDSLTTAAEHHLGFVWRSQPNWFVDSRDIIFPLLQALTLFISGYLAAQQVIMCSLRLLDQRLAQRFAALRIAGWQQLPHKLNLAVSLAGASLYGLLFGQFNAATVVSVLRHLLQYETSMGNSVSPPRCSCSGGSSTSRRCLILRVSMTAPC